MKPDGNTIITLQLTIDTANIILGALGSQSFDRVAPVVALIREQAGEQIAAMTLQANLDLSEK